MILSNYLPSIDIYLYKDAKDNKIDTQNPRLLQHNRPRLFPKPIGKGLQPLGHPIKPALNNEHDKVLALEIPKKHNPQYPLHPVLPVQRPNIRRPGLAVHFNQLARADILNDLSSKVLQVVPQEDRPHQPHLLSLPP